MDNLTRDAIAAEKAGMSYGKYMAKRSQADRESYMGIPAKADSLGSIKCKECGKLFRPVRKGNVFCSQACGDRMRSREKYRRIHGFYDKEAD